MAKLEQLMKEAVDAAGLAESKINALAMFYGQELGNYDRLQELTRHSATIHGIRVGLQDSPKSAIQSTVVYPNFKVEADALVYRNFRRGGHGVYAHRVPKDQYMKIAKIFSGVSKPGHAVSTPALIEKCSDMPSYLPRVVIAMLKKMKIAHGSRGAVVLTGTNLETDMISVWEELKK